MMNETIKLVIHDWSNGGSMTSETLIKCNHTSDQLQKAYTLGAKKIGFDITNHNGKYIMYSDMCKFSKHGLRPSELTMNLEQNHIEHEENSRHFSPMWLTKSRYVMLWLFTTMTGDENLRYKILEDNASVIGIGGWNCFNDIYDS